MKLGLSLALSTALSTGGGGAPSAPIPSNYLFLAYGDSRTDDGKPTGNSGGLLSGMASIGYAPWLVIRSGGKLMLGRNANFAIPASTTYTGSTVPRQNYVGSVTAGDAFRSSSATLYSDNKGADYANTHEAGIGVLLYGTNDGGVSDPGYLTTSRTNIETILNNAPSKVWIVCNELPKGINDDGTDAGYTVSANFKAYSDWLLTLDYASGHANSRPNVIAIDTFGEFVDPATGTNYKNKRGYLRGRTGSPDGLHCSGYGGRRIADKIVERLSAIWPGFSSLPRHYPLPTTSDNGLVSMGNAQPFINSNADMLPGTNGSVLGTWASPPLASGVPQGWTVTISSGSTITCVADKSEVDDEGYPVLKLTVSGTLTGANSSCQIQVYQLAPIATLFTNGWMTINDKLRAVGKAKVDAGSQYFSGVALVALLQTIAPTTRYQTLYCGRGGSVINMGAPAYLDSYDGQWGTYTTEELDLQNPGKLALGEVITAQGDINNLWVRWEIDFRNIPGGTVNVGATIRLSRTGLQRT